MHLQGGCLSGKAGPHRVDGAPLNIIKVTRLASDCFYGVAECLCCGAKDCFKTWELSFVWGNGSEKEYISEACGEWYETIWKLCGNTANLPIEMYNFRPLQILFF